MISLLPLVEAHPGVCTNDTMTYFVDEFTGARACGCGPHEELVLHTHDQLLVREAHVAAISDCEASALLADRAGNDNDAMIAHLYARQARDNLHAIRRDALKSHACALDTNNLAKHNKLELEAAIRSCEDVFFAGQLSRESDVDNERWVVDVLKRGYLALRDVSDTRCAEQGERSVEFQAPNTTIRGHLLGVDRLRRIFVSLECGLDHDSRIWCLPSQRDGPWYQIEGASNISALQSSLDVRGSRECLLQAELASLHRKGANQT